MNLVGHGRQSAFSRAVMTLAVFEILYLPKEELNRKYHPSNAARNIAKRYNRKFELLTEANGKGWTVKRVK